MKRYPTPGEGLPTMTASPINRILALLAHFPLRFPVLDFSKSPQIRVNSCNTWPRAHPTALLPGKHERTRYALTKRISRSETARLRWWKRFINRLGEHLFGLVNKIPTHWLSWTPSTLLPHLNLIITRNYAGTLLRDLQQRVKIVLHSESGTSYSTSQLILQATCITGRKNRAHCEPEFFDHASL
jgi:hypothetical protein